MPEAPRSTAAANAVFLSLVDFSKRPVAEQAELNERLEALVAAAIAPLDPANRIVLDTADGLAVVVPGPPDSALDLAARVLRKAHGLPVRVGINHGPVRLAPGPRNDPKLVGDGLVAGAAVASFAKPGQLLVSRSFRDALAAIDPPRASGLREAGTFTDAQVRAHELFAPDRRARSARRRLVVVASLAVAGILGSGIAVRVVRRVRRARQPAVVELAITPWGEITIDGERKGKTPPLRRLEVTPGRHMLEVRSGSNAPVTLDIDLAPGERITVRHEFPPPRAETPKSATPKNEPPSRARPFLKDQRKPAEGGR